MQFAEIIQSLKAGENRDAQIRTLFESLNTGMSNLQEGIAEVVSDLRRRNYKDTWENTVFAQNTPLSFLVPSASGFNFPSESQGAFKRARMRLEELEKAEAIKEAKEAKESKDKK